MKKNLTGLTLGSARSSLQRGRTSSQSLASLAEVYKSQAKLHLMIAVDATGSMQQHWQWVRQQLDEAIRRVDTIQTVDLELKLLAFRDYDLGEWLLEQSCWTKDPTSLLPFLNDIVCRTNSTGDEAVEAALAATASDPNVQRVILIGDAPPHTTPPGGRPDYTEECQRLAKRTIPVFPLVVGDYSETIRTFRNIAELTKGSFGMLESAQDILDAIALVVLDAAGGTRAVQKYCETYTTSLKASSLTTKLLRGS